MSKSSPYPLLREGRRAPFPYTLSYRALKEEAEAGATKKQVWSLMPTSQQLRFAGSWIM